MLLLGDSIFDLHEGDKRIEAVMKNLLEQRSPLVRWTIYNEAHGGEYIGPKEGTPKGVSEPLFTTEKTGRYFEIVHRHARVDAVIVNYGGNDSKVYPPATFRKRIEALGRVLEKDYPGAVLIFATTMFVDPKHSAPYHRDDPKAPGFENGRPRNEYLEPYNHEIREFTAAHGYRLADVCRRIARETERGNWDFRLRQGQGDPREDPKHQGDMAWFDNIHPNDRGTKIIADVLVEALTKSGYSGHVRVR
ncbi:MAG: SGNH/GDSL hydrolase family protein [Acidobacteria bacterium]|nr:SGNH/GDSL hydrolase family protein [Acidobacteriota bacterium]